MRKGMSQTLALIVAASVLMMTAMTVIFMVQGGLGDVNQGTNRQGCIGTLQAICSGTDGTVNTPGACTSDGQLIPSISPGTGIGTEETSCRTFKNNY